MSNRAFIQFPPIMTVRCSRWLVARDCFSRTSRRSIDVAKCEDIARFSIKIRAARGRATICRIFTFNWLTDESAERYDTQVEVLLNGTANAMGRQALPQLHELFAGRDQRHLHLLDIGCGTGRFLDFVAGLATPPNCRA